MRCLCRARHANNVCLPAGSFREKCGRSGSAFPQAPCLTNAAVFGRPNVDARQAASSLWARNRQFRRQAAILASRAVGLRQNTLVEVRTPTPASAPTRAGDRDREIPGQGLVVFSGLDAVARVGDDPVADALLTNIITYLQHTEGTVGGMPINMLGLVNGGLLAQACVHVRLALACVCGQPERPSEQAA